MATAEREQIGRGSEFGKEKQKVLWMDRQGHSAWFWGSGKGLPGERTLNLSWQRAVRSGQGRAGPDKRSLGKQVKVQGQRAAGVAARSRAKAGLLAAWGLLTSEAGSPHLYVCSKFSLSVPSKYRTPDLRECFQGKLNVIYQ